MTSSEDRTVRVWSDGQCAQTDHAASSDHLECGVSTEWGHHGGRKVINMPRRFE